MCTGDKMAEGGKLLKKMARKRAQFLASEPQIGVKFLDYIPSAAGDLSSSYHLFIGNGGTRNGLSSEVLSSLLECVDHLYMPEAKDFSFASVTGSSKAAHILTQRNSLSVQDACRAKNITHLISLALLEGPPLHLYISLVDNVPIELLECQSTQEPALPPGLILVPQFISLREERELLAFFAAPVAGEYSEHCNTIQSPSACGVSDIEQVEISRTGQNAVSETYIESADVGCPSQQTLSVTSSLKHRTVSHYGYEFIYGKNTVNPSCPLPRGVPDICAPVLERMMSKGLLHWTPDQLTVNDYLPGAGIPPHIDTHSPFEDGIASLTLGSQVVMDFRRPDGKKIAVFLPRRSLLVMTSESRYLWSHGITPRKTDEVHPNMPGFCNESLNLGKQFHDSFTVVPRGRRVSLTFRKVRRSPCTCSYPTKCDSQQQNT